VKVTREVVNDLLPVYAAGEASADTKALVEEFLRSDTEFAALVQNEQPLELLRQPVVAPPDREHQNLKRLKWLIQTQTWFLAVALLFTILPLSIKIEDGAITFFMLQRTPWLAAIYWLIAAAMWLGYFRTRRRLRVTGI
jgi:hypothetical protein